MADIAQETQSQVGGVIRNVLSYGGGFITAHGWLDSATTQQLLGALLPLISIGWGIYSKHQDAKVLNTVPKSQGGNL
jgi:hypothetical protein